jgi:O-Antigen ligase
VSTAVYEREFGPRKSVLLWFFPAQVAAALTVWAIAAGGQVLRAWILTALVWVMTLPLLVSLEASLFAMMLFEPLRGLLRRGQYLFLDYSSQDPIHVLTPIVTVFVLISLVRTQKFSILWASPLAGWVSLLALLYFVEIFNPLQGGMVVGLSGAMFTLAPLVWFYFGQNIRDNFVERLLVFVVVVGLVTSLWGVYQLLFGYPAFEQYWISHTEFYNSIAVGHIERALATFSSAEEWGRYTEFGAIAAFGFALRQKRPARRFVWIGAGIGLIGFVMLSGQRAAIFGLMLGLTVLVMMGARNLGTAIMRMLLLLLPFVLVLVLVKAPEAEDLFSNDETQTVSTILQHTQRGVLKPADEGSLQERLTNWGFLLTQVIPFRPLGSGIGAGTLSEWRFNQDAEELPPIDNSILLQGITCGFPGMLLFLWVMSRGTLNSIQQARRSSPDDPQRIIKRTVAAIMCAMALNTVFGMTSLLYSVAPLVWLLMGWTSASMLRAGQETERETIVI